MSPESPEHMYHEQPTYGRRKFPEMTGTTPRGTQQKHHRGYAVVLV
jgi:hypothetical protein